MKMLKNTIIPVIIILLAATIVVILALPLAGTEWADSFRPVNETTSANANEVVGETSEQVPDSTEDNSTPALLNILLPILKVTLFMGVGGILTILIRSQTKRFIVSKQKT